MLSTPQHQHRRSSYAAFACVLVDDLELGSSSFMANILSKTQTTQSVMSVSTSYLCEHELHNLATALPSTTTQ